MQELVKFNLKIYVITNGSEKYMSYVLNSLVKNLNNDDFKYLSQELGNNVLDLVKQTKILSL